MNGQNIILTGKAKNQEKVTEIPTQFRHRV